MVAAAVGLSEEWLQTVAASISDSITVVGVEIQGADGPLELQVGECVTLTALAAPAGRVYN